MDDLEYAKIGGAICAALLAFVGLGQLAKAMVHVDQVKEPAYAIEIPVESDGSQVAEVEVDILPLIASADMATGQKVWRSCKSCHNYEAGGAHGTGPNLYGVVGRQVASAEGFGKYSGNLPGETWTFDNLNAFLTKPKDYAKGTSMNFKGMKKPEDRAALIAFLNTQSDAPLPVE